MRPPNHKSQIRQRLFNVPTSLHAESVKIAQERDMSLRGYGGLAIRLFNEVTSKGFGPSRTKLIIDGESVALPSVHIKTAETTEPTVKMAVTGLTPDDDARFLAYAELACTPLEERFFRSLKFANFIYGHVSEHFFMLQDRDAAPIILLTV